MVLERFREQVNAYASREQAFLFLIDFEKKKPRVCPLSAVDPSYLRYQMAGQSNVNQMRNPSPALSFQSFPIAQAVYQESFQLVMRHLQRGDSFLLNLTFPTRIEMNIQLEELFGMAQAPYKLWLKDQLLVFSPECFVKIKNNGIYAYPMKGTIDASLPEAEKLILQNPKEQFEHNTIVDLIRNDLALVARDIQVTKFRYLDRIQTHQGELLQVSSEIRGQLPPNWKENLGDILLKLLPAGSVSGAPKPKTLEIIRQAEGEERGYYTGIFGIFDGQQLDSAVNIRYIEQTSMGLRFRSGGGLTALSQMAEEYQEMIDKVYVPIA